MKGVIIQQHYLRGPIQCNKYIITCNNHSSKKKEDISIN